MLSINSNKQEKKLITRFDTPIPNSLLSNVELCSVTKDLKDFADASFVEEDNHLVGFSVRLPNWISFLEKCLSPQELPFYKKATDLLFEGDDSKQNKGLQINFHQKSFDSPERYWNFIFNQGNFKDYFFNRISWQLGPQNSYVSPFPVHVDIESANTCNMNCPMCFRDMMKDVGQMELPLFKKIIDECADNNVYSVRLSWRGETLTHPRIKEIVAYATKKIKNVSFLTNAFYIDDHMADCFIDNGVNYIAVSFDGIGKVYEAIRHPAKFEENYKRLATLLEKREKKNRKRPQVRLTTIWPAIREDPEAYYEKMKNVSDYIVYNPYINYKGRMELKKDFICQYPWERIMVAFNGDTQCCTGWNTSSGDIILGNAKDKTIYEMWHGEQMNEIRDIHARGGRMELNSCAHCRHGSKGDPNINIWEIIERRY